MHLQFISSFTGGQKGGWFCVCIWRPGTFKDAWSFYPDVNNLTALLDNSMLKHTGRMIDSCQVRKIRATDQVWERTQSPEEELQLILNRLQSHQETEMQRNITDCYKIEPPHASPHPSRDEVISESAARMLDHTLPQTRGRDRKQQRSSLHLSRTSTKL